LNLKAEFLELLKKDEEFRSAVLAYLDLERLVKGMEEHLKIQREILKRIEKLEENQTRLWEEVKELREGQTRLWEEVKELREGQTRLCQTRLWEEVKELREGQTRLWEEVKELREDFNEMLVRIGRVERTLEKLTLEIEEEAREIVEWRLRKASIFMSLEVLQLPEVEINLYGVWMDVCLLGEATVRAGTKIIEELLGKVALMERKYPDRLRPHRILVIYTCRPTGKTVELAKEKGIWLLTATADLTPPPPLLAEKKEEKQNPLTSGCSR